MMPWTQGSAAGVGDRSQTWNAVGDQDARHAAKFAFRAHRLGWQPWFTPDEQRGEGIEQLSTVDGASGQLVVNGDVLRGRRGGGQRIDVFGFRVHDGGELGDVGKVAERLHAPAVAHAPIVTKSFDWSRISRIRCASRRVVIEPSTSDTS